MKYADIKTKKDRIAYIKKALTSSPAWATKGLLRIYEHQTADEQLFGETTEHNGVGFNGFDGDILSSFAKQVLNSRQLTQKQMKIVHKAMPKYAKQLESLTTVKTNNPTELNVTVIEDDELLNLYHSLQASLQYYECAEGNYSAETAERNECERQFNKAYNEASKRGLL